MLLPPESPNISPSANWDEFTRQRNCPHSKLQSQTFESLNIQALEQIATRLRDTPCRVNASKYAYGGVNIVLELAFNDTVNWIARIRVRDPDDQLSAINYGKLLMSEVATMRFLKRKTTIPVPEVFGYDCRDNNPVGLPYILMEAMPGRNLWGGGMSDFIPDAYKEKVYQQFSDILVQLYSNPFTRIGMLYPAENSVEETVGEIVDLQARIPNYGPFTNSNDFYHLRTNLLSESHNAALASGAEVPDLREAYKLKLAALQYIVEPTTANGPFFLAHPDFQVPFSYP